MAHSAGRLRENFMYPHFKSKVAVFQGGTEPLPRRDLCGMHMPAGRLIRHRKTARYDKNTQMRWRRWDVAITARFLEATFSLTGEEEEECINGVEVLKCLGQILDRSDDNWPAVLCSIKKARKVWGWHGKLLWREEA